VRVSTVASVVVLLGLVTTGCGAVDTSEDTTTTSEVVAAPEGSDDTTTTQLPSTTARVADEGSTDQGGRISTCGELLTVAEVERHMGEPAYESETDNRLEPGETLCVWRSKSIETKQMLSIGYYDGSRSIGVAVIEANIPPDPDDTDSLELGDRSFLKPPAGSDWNGAMYTGFLEGRVAALLTWTQLVAPGDGPRLAAKHTTLVELTRLVHDRST
jgi:hypothetical protein